MNCTFEATLQWVRSLTPTTRGLNSFLVDHATATTHIILVQFDGTNRACWRLSILSRHLSSKGNRYKKWSLWSLKAQHLEAANLTRPMQIFCINFIRCRQCGDQCFRTQQLKGTDGWIELVVFGLRVQFVFGFAFVGHFWFYLCYCHGLEKFVDLQGTAACDICTTHSGCAGSYGVHMHIFATMYLVEKTIYFFVLR